jgi:uncharacterized protein
MRDKFKKNIIEFQERALPNLTAREYTIPTDAKKIVSLIGIRRSGKTSILFNMIKRLSATVGVENIVYINFEDDRLFGLELKNLDDLIEAYYELYPDKRSQKVYLFLDEILNIKNWELFVRRIYDTLKLQLFITGSSSKLLSAEIASCLRGRTITFEIFPFSFKEYLQYKNIKINLHSPRSLNYIKNAFDSYLKEGGFPECINEDKFIRGKILSDYMNLIIYKDIVERYNIKNKELLRHLIKYCFINIGTLLSFNKLYNQYKSLGYKLSKDSLFEYFSYLEEAYTLFKIPIYRASLKEQLRNPKKIYAVDNALKGMFEFSFSEDYSKLYENLTFLHLRRQSSEIYYFKQNQEVDFYTVIDGKKLLINVCFDLSDIETRQRELDGLLEAMKFLNINESFLLTKSEESIVKMDNYVIKIEPLFKYLLQEN